MAGFGTTYPDPGLKPGFFLKDLYVTASERGGRIATHLLQHLARLAEERGLTRINWTAARDNHRLLEFYDRIGGQRKEDRIFFRLEGDKLTALARHYN
jgi:GNAT superfamily N-acetyltransferase